MNSSIESIFIPRSLVELNDEWCYEAPKLTRIKIDSQNPRYSFFDNKFIIGKSTESSKNYDVLVFSRRDITEARIPSFIKSIESHTFAFCTQLRHVEIFLNSELRTIGKYAFRKALIEYITLPSKLTKLCEKAFLDCGKLKKVEIPSDSELKTIEQDVFSGTIIESIFIPASLVELKDGWCIFTKKLTKILIDPLNPRYSFLDNKFIIGKSTESSENYDELVFCRRDIKVASIPSYIKSIKKYAFGCCQLQCLKFQPDSELRTIEDSAFTKTLFQCFRLPSQVVRICDRAFMLSKIQHIEIPRDSKLRTIEAYAFTCSAIESFFLPSHVTRICEGTFGSCHNLRRFEIPPDSELRTIEEKAFNRAGIESLVIPSHVTHIGEGAFNYCKKLQIIEFSQKIENCQMLKNLFQNVSQGVIIMIPA